MEQKVRDQVWNITTIFTNKVTGQYQVRYEWVELEESRTWIAEPTGRPSIADNNRVAKSKKKGHWIERTKARVRAALVDVERETAKELYELAKLTDQVFNIERNDLNGQVIIRLKYEAPKHKEWWVNGY